MNEVKTEKKINLRKIIFVCLIFLATNNFAEAGVIGKTPNNLSLVGYWSFNEATSTTARDFSGSGNNGTVYPGLSGTNTATSSMWVQGKLGNAVTFDGTDDYIDAGTGSTLDPGTGSFTVGGWYKTSAASQITMFDKNCNGASNDGYVARMESNGTLSTAFMANGPRRDVASTISVNDGLWHHIIIKLDRSTSPDDLRVYIDGVDRSGTQSNTLDGQSVADANPLFIGKMRTTCSGGANWNGSMDDLRVYNRAISTGEITYLYGSGATKRKSADNTGLVGYWSFNEATSTTARDFSGSGNNGTVYPGLSGTNTATSSMWVQGKLGNAVTFDGTDDYISVPNATALQLFQNGKQSVSMWLNFSGSPSSSQAILDNWKGYEGACGGNAIGSRIIRTTSNTIQYQLRNNNFSGNDVTLTTNTALATGKFYHVVVVTDATSSGGSTKIYINGVQDTSATITSPTDYNHSQKLYLGAHYNDCTGVAPSYQGYIDDLRIYSTALTPAQVSALYQVGATKLAASQNGKFVSGLVGLWSFDGLAMSGTTAFDRSGQGANATLTSGPALTFGKIGQALSLDGTDDYAVSNSFTGHQQSSGTLVLWAYPTTVTGGADNFYAAGVGGLTTTGANRAIRIYNGGDWSLVGYGSGVTEDWNNIVAASVNRWAHVAYVWNGTTIKFYLNGVEYSTTRSGLITPTGTVMTVGVAPWSTSTGNWKGKVDDARVYNRALSATEVQQLYAVGR